MAAPSPDAAGTPPAPPIGAPVFTADGARLGDVALIAGEHFSVAAARGRDFWLSCEFVSHASGGYVELDFDVEFLDAYRLDHPPPGSTAGASRSRADGPGSTA